MPKFVSQNHVRSHPTSHHKNPKKIICQSFQSHTTAPPLISRRPIANSTQKHMSSEKSNDAPEPKKKRNSGHTGPTTPQGRATSARNATRHGMCATTLIMEGELESDWFELLKTWLAAYQNPAESDLLYTFVVKTAQAEWHRLRVQREYDFHLFGHGNPPIAAWEPHEIKNHDLILRYLTTAERRFQREYRLLEHHWKTHHKCGAGTPAGRVETPLDASSSPALQPMPEVRYLNCETGESVDDHGNHYPPPPDWKPIPIIPGVHHVNHPANPLSWRPPK